MARKEAAASNYSMISLTALVLTYNEQENIRRNLEALVWVPKVIVLDSFSNDQTLEIARSFQMLRLSSAFSILMPINGTPVLIESTRNGL